jgi:hypothetical protein
MESLRKPPGTDSCNHFNSGQAQFQTEHWSTVSDDHPIRNFVTYLIPSQQSNIQDHQLEPGGEPTIKGKRNKSSNDTLPSLPPINTYDSMLDR